MDFQDKILAMARTAPLTPTIVAKAVGKDSLIASAMLSSIVGKGLLKISHVKVGSTPLYYDPVHEDQLQNYASYLNEKDRRVYDVLKEKKVLRESALDPLSRVCVKNIKDFARPLEVSFGGNKEIFWKWYMLPDFEAEPIIRNILSGPVSAPEHPAGAAVSESPQAPVHHSIPVVDAQLSAFASVPVEPVNEMPPESSPEPKPRVVKKKKVEAQRRIVDKIKDMIVPRAVKGADDFLGRLKLYFEDNDISVVSSMEQKRKAEFEFIVEINSCVGPLVYYCNAKDKKRVSEADLSNAFVQGQLLKLPVLFVTNGGLTKQAEKISKDFKGIAVRKI